MSTKSNIRSFRYSDKVAKVLEGFQGGSLNEKFENLVLYCFDRLETREKELKRIEKDIEAKRNEYFTLCKQLQDVTSLMRTLETLQHYGKIAADSAELIAKGLDSRGNPKEDVTQKAPAANRPRQSKCVTPDDVLKLNKKYPDKSGLPPVKSVAAEV